MASKGSSRKNIQYRKKPASSHKLTQADIEARLARRASAVQDKVRRLEKSQLVTEDTMRLEFQPLISSAFIIQDDKLS